MKKERIHWLPHFHISHLLISGEELWRQVSESRRLHTSPSQTWLTLSNPSPRLLDPSTHQYLASFPPPTLTFFHLYGKYCLPPWMCSRQHSLPTTWLFLLRTYTVTLPNLCKLSTESLYFPHHLTPSHHGICWPLFPSLTTLSSHFSSPRPVQCLGPHLSPRLNSISDFSTGQACTLFLYTCDRPAGQKIDYFRLIWWQ